MTIVDLAIHILLFVTGWTMANAVRRYHDGRSKKAGL